VRLEVPLFTIFWPFLAEIHEKEVPGMALDGRVLLLNQTYEPLGTVSVPRAVVMTFKDTVTVEEFDGDRVLRSPRAEFRVPSVIRRRTYINVRRRRGAASVRPNAQARAEWRKYIFMDVYDDRDVRDRVASERVGRERVGRERKLRRF
jgi:hypothetical protein